MDIKDRIFIRVEFAKSGYTYDAMIERVRSIDPGRHRSENVVIPAVNERKRRDANASRKIYARVASRNTMMTSNVEHVCRIERTRVLEWNNDISPRENPFARARESPDICAGLYAINISVTLSNTKTHK